MVGEALLHTPTFYYVKFYHRLRSYHSNEMAQFAFNVAEDEQPCDDCVRDS